MAEFDPMELFRSMGLPNVSMPTPAEVQKEARKRSTDLLSQWNTLQRILERHEEVLRKRWMKKTKTQRTQILLGAWPKMSQNHRPDYEAWFKEGSQIKSRGTKFREAYLFPSINVEDLARGKSLLLFLNSRGRNPPSMFAHADFEATHLGHVIGATVPAFLNLHTMFLEGESVTTYGRLVSWDEDEEAMDKMMTRLAHQPGEGLVILEIQQKILRFLVDCCRKILHDIDASALISDQTPIKPEPHPMVENSSEWPTMASLATEAPYRVPARIDFKRLRSVVEAKRSSVENHVRSLREDPAYFSEFVQDWSIHRQETLPDTKGARHPILDKPLFWDRVLGNVVMDAYGAVVAWSLVSQQLTLLSSLQEKYANVISPQKKLPKEYTKALLTFQYTLDQMRKAPILDLTMGLPASPHFRSQFVREPQISGSTMIYLRRVREEDRMFWLFSKLWDEHQLFLVGFPTLVDELERLMESDPKEKEKVSSWVARVFSDLGLIAKARHELDIYMPWAAGFENDMIDHRETIKKEFADNFTALADLQKHLENVPFSKNGTPTGSVFYYPSDKRRTQQNVESMRKAEQHLDAFWEAVDERYKKKSGKSLHEAFRHLLTDDQPLERTPEWVEPIKEPEHTMPAQNSELTQTLRHLFIDGQDYPSKVVPAQQKIKLKTRGLALTDTASADEAMGEHEDAQPIFTVANRAFRVFKTLFHTPSATDLPGEVAWTDFLFAMAATGFAPEKLYGSVWQFTPTRLDVERSIQFHEPHPRGKIPYRTARRIGRRLTRTYGWHGRMFVQGS